MKCSALLTASLIFLPAATGCMPYAYQAWPPRTHPATGEMQDDHAVIRVLYATDRNITGNLRPREYFGGNRTREVHYGHAEVTIPPAHGRGRSELPALGAGSESRNMTLQELVPAESRDAFVADLRAKVARSAKHEIFVFIHGYCVTFPDAVIRGAQLVHDIDLDAVPVIYSWPAQGSLLSYLVDTGNAEWSAVYLADFLDMLARQSGAQHIHIMAHSMGTQVLARAIKEYAAQHAAGESPPFDQVILMAADMDADVFERDYLGSLLRNSRRLSIYVSGVDWALGGSRLLHHYARLGQIGAPNIPLAALRKMDMIDATDCDRGLVGHFYYSECPTILEDVHRLLEGETAQARGLDQRFFYRIELDNKTPTVPLTLHDSIAKKAAASSK